MIKCEICGKEMKYLTHSHLKIHKIKLKDYKEIYPETDIGLNPSQRDDVKEKKENNIIKELWC